MQTLYNTQFIRAKENIIFLGHDKFPARHTDTFINRLHLLLQTAKPKYVVYTEFGNDSRW